MGKAGV